MSFKIRIAVSLFGVVALILVAAAFVSNDGDDASPPLDGWMQNFTPTTALMPAPAFSFQDRGLKSLGLADFSGRLALVNFWATWCGPCIREMQTLQYALETAPSYSSLTRETGRRGARKRLEFAKNGSWSKKIHFIESHLFENVLHLRWVDISSE